jgi:RecB family endonuclease NucS
MISGIALNQTPNGWEFTSEAALEKYIWANLKEILNFHPIKQQYVCNGEICDIIATDGKKGLIIIELKNTEDRYLIQQLTRYYANLLEEKPFAEKIDYSLPVRLIGIAPNYHRHNLIDRSFNKLFIELLQFSVMQEGEDYFFTFQDIEGEEIQGKYLIPYQPIKAVTREDIPEPPDLLIKWLGGCTKEEQEGFLRIRSKILACNPRMKEMVDKTFIQYGSGKTKLCAEFRFQRKAQKPILFMWLPTPNTYYSSRRKNQIGRLRIWTNGLTISHVGHIANGFGKMKTKEEWDLIPKEKRPKSGWSEGFSNKSNVPVETEIYLRCRESPEKIDFWETLSDLAIESWLNKS